MELNVCIQSIFYSKGIICKNFFSATHTHVCLYRLMLIKIWRPLHCMNARWIIDQIMIYTINWFANSNSEKGAPIYSLVKSRPCAGLLQILGFACVYMNVSNNCPKLCSSQCKGFGISEVVPPLILKNFNISPGISIVLSFISFG